MPVQSTLAMTDGLLPNLSPTPTTPTTEGTGKSTEEGDAPAAKNEIHITTSLKLYISSKSKQKKKIWVQVTSENDFLVTVVPGETTYDDFLDLVAATCDLKVPNTGDIVAENKPDLNWNVTLTRVKGWLKSDAKTVTDASSYDSWIAAIVACKANDKKKEPLPCLALRMRNPADLVKRGKQADILAKRAKLKKAMELRKSAKRKAGDDIEEEMCEDEEGEIDPEDWNDVDFHMRALFDANPINREYDNHCPVFLHPTVPGRYILLTMAACQEWAMAIMDEKMPAVNMLSPPKTLNWEDLGSPSKKKKTSPTPAPAPMAEDKAIWCRLMVEAFAEASKGCTKEINAPSPPSSDGIPYVPESEAAIGDYLRFLNLRNLDRVLDVLTSNDILCLQETLDRTSF
ncbi:hypothetical protein PGTUg99_004109 [Puccinia graminis f. sp. tritici]|uniref:Uncharacterized protein n=1 Tax=Puccinia graminis f. sp. tritici TaxID=56615 RepID=A0A5B0RS38_PUCGR|nr:hypothetical protein PGTUg99_004109 [Puccinia graminis f. sp. tritici]